MRGILLAGGTGSRLFPATIATSKQLLPVAGRPLVLFPLCTLMEAGIREVCVITMPRETERFRGLLGTGNKWGIIIEYFEQDEPRGIAEAFLIAQSFIEKEPMALILGDNIFLGAQEAITAQHGRAGSCCFITPVAHPERYGVISFDRHDRIADIKEKPRQLFGRTYAVTGLYLCAPSVVEIASGLKPSKRGELEITDVLNEFNRRGQLRAVKLPPAAVWMDCGTPADLMEATNLIHAMEKRTGEIIGSPEIVALRQGWITPSQFEELIRQKPPCSYRDSLCESQNRNQNRATSRKP
jgi:glucose-1-phosphate thymidylyltransferase